MSDNTTATVAPIKPVYFTARNYVWMVSTFALAPIVASLLSIGGYIPTDPITAAIDGVIVSIVYVGYRVINAYRQILLYKRIQEKVPQN